jgi:hypothetical protein
VKKIYQQNRNKIQNLKNNDDQKIERKEKRAKEEQYLE